MKFFALSAAITTLTGLVQGVSSDTKGLRGQHRVSLLSDLQKHGDFNPDQDVGPMLKSAESMLLNLADSAGGTPLADLVAAIRPFILQMQDSIITSHNNAQQTLTNFQNDFSGCSTAQSNGESEANSLQSTTSGLSNTHKACRTQEHAAHQQMSACENTLNNLCDAKDSSCQVLADAERTPGCHAIPPSPGETWKSYVTRAAAWFRSEANSYLHKEAVCNNDTAKWQAQTLICRGSDGNSGTKKEYEDKKIECDQAQAQLESATCSYVTKVDETCGNFGNCQNTVADGYDAQLPGIQTLEHQRKVEWNATERLLCLLGAYGADGSVDATKLQACPLIGDNTSHLNLVYPTSTSRPGACPALLPHPCDATYLSQEYGNLDANAANCTPCTFASGGGSGGGGSGGGGSLTTTAGNFASGLKEICAITPGGKLRCSGDGVRSLAFTATVANDFAWQKISIGRHHFCGILTDGSLKCKDGSASANMPAGTFIDVASGYDNSCGVRDDGTLHCWGNGGAKADLENNIPTTHNGAYAKVWIGPAYYDACAVTTDGTAECWGRPNHYLTPARTAGQSFLQVQTTAYGDVGCGLKSDQTVVCWSDHYPEIRNAAPVQPFQGRIVQISVGYYMMCALVDDGQVVCWGRSSPLQDLKYSQWEPGTNLAPTCQRIGVGWKQVDCQLMDGSMKLFPDADMGDKDCPQGCFTSPSEPSEIYEVYGHVMAAPR